MRAAVAGIAMLALGPAACAQRGTPLDDALVDDVPEAVVVVDPGSFSCLPAVIRPGMALVLRKHERALDELAAIRPGSDAMHFLVVQQPPADLQPLMTTEALAAARRVTIDVDTVEGLEWSVGAIQERLFTVAGRYEFILSPTLESEEGGFRCVVEFRP